jgi:hypothetical protein
LCCVCSVETALVGGGVGFETFSNCGSGSDKE